MEGQRLVTLVVAIPLLVAALIIAMRGGLRTEAAAPLGKLQFLSDHFGVEKARCPFNRMEQSQGESADGSCAHPRAT